MKTNTLGFIGGGRITRVFLQAFKNKSIEFDSVDVYDTNKEVLVKLKEQFPDIVTTESVTGPSEKDMVILAVHPPVMMETLNNIKDKVNAESIILSLAPKISIDKMSKILPSNKIVRMIPNATSIINMGYNPLSFHDSFTKEEKEKFINTFSILGHTFEVEEYKLEGYAITSAMLPTYFWFQWEKMEEIAEGTGLTNIEAEDTLYNTLKFANEIFYRSDYDHQEVIDLIPVKPIGENESEINSILGAKLIGLYDKIKSVP